MTTVKTPLAMAGGLLTTLCVAVFAQNGPDQPGPASSQVSTLVLPEEATVDWIEYSKVSSLREGVIEKIELKLGDLALKDHAIGYLHRESARLAVAKAKIQADATGAIEKGEAAFFVAVQTVARNQRLNEKKPGLVSAEDVAKAEGELKVAKAQTKEAVEQQAVAKAEFAIADQALKEHTIVAPFDGVIIKMLKRPARASGPMIRSSRSASSRGSAPTAGFQSGSPSRSRRGRSSKSIPSSTPKWRARRKSRACGSGARSPSSTPRFRLSANSRAASAPSSTTPTTS